MLEAVLVVVTALFVTAAPVLWLRFLERSNPRWFADGLREAARVQGIRFSPRRPYSRSAVGVSGDLSVRVESRQRRTIEGENEYWLDLCVSVAGLRIPQRLEFSAERGTGDDVLTGDTVFDDLVEVRGEASIVLALLDRGLRQRMSEFVRLGGRLRGGRLEFCAPATFSQGEIARAVGATLRLARELSSAAGGGICERLARNAVSDPHPSVRLWNLLQLQEQFAGTPEAGEASRADLGDPSPWVRLSAARFLRDEGHGALEGLTRDRGVPEQAAAEAVALLPARGDNERAGPVLLTVLKTRTGEARRQAIQELGRLRHPPALGPLIVLLERADPRTAAAAASALGSLGDAKAEPALVKAVETDERELRLAAARALGSLGNVRSVEPLLALLQRRLDAESRQGIREAIGAIQSRLAGAEAGQLSLATSAPGSGWLSLAAPTAGQGDLSLADPGPE